MKLASAPHHRAAGRVLAIASGKGGVGKTTLAVGMARALSLMDERVLLMDGDLGMANIDVQLGLQPRADIVNVLSGKTSLEDAVCPAIGGAAERGGFDVISGRSGSGALANLSGPGLTKLATGVAALALSYDPGGHRSARRHCTGRDTNPDLRFRAGARLRRRQGLSSPCRNTRARPRSRVVWATGHRGELKRHV